MILPMFDQSRKNERSVYGESVRLSNELRFKTAFSRIENGITVRYPDEWGFDCETADYDTFVLWLKSNVKKSASKFWFVIRLMAWRFPEKHREIRQSLSERRRIEFDLILSEMKKEVEWIGRVGYTNLTVLSEKSKNRTIKLSNDHYKVIK